MLFRHLVLFSLIIAIVVSGCDCGGEPEFKLDDLSVNSDISTDVISDISQDAIQDVQIKDTGIDVSEDISDVIFDANQDASEDILDISDLADAISDVEEQDVVLIDSSEDILQDVQGDIENDVINPDALLDVSDAYESDAISDVSESDAISDVVADGGLSKTVIKNCPSSPNNLSSISFEFSNDLATTFECKLNDSQWVVCSSPYEIPNNDIGDLPDGENHFMVRGVINGEYEIDPAECMWVKDTSKPDTIFSVKPDFECKNYATLEFEATESGCGFEYSLDSADWVETTSPLELSGLGEGEHIVRIRARDAAGNVDDTPLEYRFVTDTVSPDLNILSKPATFTNSNEASFSFASSDPLAIFLCSFDQGAFYECTSPQIYKNLSEQSHTFRVFSQDGCENKSAMYEYTFVVDMTAPESTIDSKPASISNDSNPSFTFSCSEESRTECRIDSGSFTPCTSPSNTGPLSDGEHRFEVRCIDRAGNVDQTPAEYVWRIDTVPPETTLTTVPDKLSRFKNATFEFTCSEGNKAECMLDVGAYQSCSSPVTYTNLSDGSHNFSVRCIDEAGNFDITPSTYNWTVDTTPPVSTITETPQSYTKSTTATFRFTCNESGTIECRLDTQSWVSCTSPKVYINLANGSHIFSVRCTDNAGNVEVSPPVYNWVVDTIPPDTSIVNHPPSVSNSTDANFIFSSNEPESTFECSLNDGLYSSCQANQSFGNLSEGTNKVCVRAIDKAGNVDSTPACYQWTIDITPPDTIIISGPASPTNQTVAIFSFDSNEVQSTFECSLDDAAFTSCVSPVTYSGLATGIHNFKVRAIDVAGNVDLSPAEYVWEVDTKAPVTTIISGPSNPSNSTTASFIFTSDDPNATYECSLDGAAFESCTSPRVYYSLSEGSHIFRVRGKDLLGNTEQNPPSYLWDIDITPPDTSLTVFPPDPTNNPAPSFSFIASEAGSTFECSYDFGAYFVCTSPHIWNNIPEGLRYFSVRAKDRAGNYDPTPSQYSFTVDLTEPETYLVNKPSNPTNSTSATFTFYSNETNTTFECKLDSGNFTTCTSPYTYNSLSDGSHTFYVRAIDLAGNIDSTPAQFDWKIDTAPPDTRILTYPSSVTSNKNAQFTFDCTDDSLPCTFECSLDGAAFSLCASPVLYTNLSDGNHTFRVRAIDAAQNTDLTPAQYSWRVDTIPPQAFIDSMPGNPSLVTDAIFTFHCNEAATTECSLDGSVYSPCTSPKTYNGLSIGSHIFAVRCIDLANNVSAAVQYIWDIMQFKVDRVDAPKFFTNFYNRAIKTDSNNIPHIVYGGDNLYHAYLSGSSFVTEIIDNSPGTGEYASLYIDGNDYLHISYYNPANLSLMYATNSGGVWSKTTVDSGNNVGLYSAIAVDKNGYVHIAYFDNTTYDLKYATNLSGVWTTSVVESQYISGEYVSIAIDSANNPHIAYYKRGFSPNKGVLRYAKKNGAVWDIQTLDDQGDGVYVGLYTSIFIDSDDNVYISYFDGSNYDLKFIRYSNGLWDSPIVVESAGDVGRYSSLVVDSNKVVHITYYNTNGTLRYANNSSGSFVAQLVDNSASVGTYNSLAIDKNGILHASYYDATNAKVKYAMRLTSGSWTNFKFVDAAGSVGQYPSIYLDSSKKVHICYYDAFFGGELKYAYGGYGDWSTSTIDNGGVSNYNVGRYCNIKTDSSNKVHISYLDVSRGNIKYITNLSGSWVSENPDNINTVGQYQTSLAVDSNGKIHISYYDSANGGELRYSNNVAGFWISTVVDDGGVTNANVGQYNSIAVDRNGYVHISYYDATNADLKYATNISGGFNSYTIDSAGNVGSYSAIAVGDSGYIAISYYDSAPNYNLKVAIFDGVSWTTEVVDSSVNNVGLYTSISIDSNNKVHIAYYDATAYKVKYATNKYGSWQSFVIDSGGRLGTNGYTTGIFATPQGMVHIVYYDYLMRDLKYATNEN